MADTVELMRKRVLDMAIRGELVEQRAEEGTAEKQYREIQVKKGLLNDNEKTSKNNNNKIPFEIPNNWKWIKLSDISLLITKGTTPKGGRDSYIDDGIMFFRAENINKIINTKNIKFIKKETHEKELARSILEENDLLITIAGTLGRSAIVNKEQLPANVNQAISIVRLIDGGLVSIEYLKYYFNSKITLDNLLSQTKVTAIPNLTLEIISNTLISLPPLQEQRRIVAKIEEIFAIIDQIGTKKEEALSIIRNMRQAALQDAIMGVLVDQDENDEPASVLYEKIQAEKEKLVKEKKIKKEKPLPAIEKDEIPFEIPESWKWVRLGDIVINRDGQRKPISMKERAHLDGEYPYYGASGIIDTINGWTHNGKFLLIGEDGANLISRSTPIAFMAEGKIWVNNHAHVLEETKGLKLEYLSSYINAIKLDVYVTGTAQPKLNQANLNKIVISLPPLAEQERIVEKLDEIMAICEQMEAILDGSSETNKALKVAE